MEKIYLKIKEVSDLIRLKSSTIHCKVKSDKNFPKPFKLGGILLWRKDELENYVETQRIK